VAAAGPIAEPLRDRFNRGKAALCAAHEDRVETSGVSGRVDRDRAPESRAPGSEGHSFHGCSEALGWRRAALRG